MKRFFLTLFVFLVAALLVAPAIAADRETFVVNKLMAHTITGYSGTNPAITAGAITAGGTLTANAAFVLEPYYYESTSGTTLTWAYSYGNFLSCSGESATVIVLPTITEAMSGYVLILKNVSGSYARTMTPAKGVDAIEATQGTLTGTSDGNVDAAGDVRAYVAIYSGDTSGTCSVWMLLLDER